MTRSGSNPRKGAGDRSSAPVSRRAGSVGRSSLWSDDEAGTAGSRSPAPADRSERHRSTRQHARAAPPERRRGAFGSFVHRHGWRAYAVPVLIAATVLFVLQLGRTSSAAPVASSAAAGAAVTAATAVGVTPAVRTAPQAPGMTSAPTSNPVARPPAPTAGPSTPPSPTGTSGSSSPAAPVVPATSGVGTTVVTSPSMPAAIGAGAAAAAALPAGQSFVAKGKGTWHLVKGTSPVMGSGGTRYTFTIEVEDGIEDAAADQDFAALVDAALADRRSWIGSGQFQLQRVDAGTPSFRISLTSQLTVRNNTLCGWDIHYEASCYARDVRRVAINDARWARGAMSFDGDRAAYRIYAVNHEVGHALGFSHRPCPVAGGPAPVMMQQSWSTADNDLALLNPQLIPMDGKVCRPNSYPYPSGPGTAVAVPVGG